MYNGKEYRDESIRVFPISNWTEINIWKYIYREQTPMVPLYFAVDRAVIEYNGIQPIVDDYRLPLHPDEKIHLKKIRLCKSGTIKARPPTSASPTMSSTTAPATGAHSKLSISAHVR